MSTDQPHNCNIDEAPQNSSSQNLTRKVKDWQDWTYTDGSLQKNEEGQDTGSGVYHPHLKRFPLCKPKRHGYNQHHLTCRASSYSSCTHTWLHTYSHRQPHITAPNQKAAVTPESSLPPHPRRCPAIQSPVHFFKVKSHAGIIGNEHADALAKKSATTYADIADTSIRIADPEGNPFYNTPLACKRRHRKPNTNPQLYPYNKRGPFSSPKALVPTKPP